MSYSSVTQCDPMSAMSTVWLPIVFTELLSGTMPANQVTWFEKDIGEKAGP